MDKRKMEKVVFTVLYSPFIVMMTATMVVYWLCSILRLPMLLLSKKVKHPMKTWLSDNMYATESIFNEMF